MPEGLSQSWCRHTASVRFYRGRGYVPVFGHSRLTRPAMEREIEVRNPPVAIKARLWTRTQLWPRYRSSHTLTITWLTWNDRSNTIMLVDLYISHLHSLSIHAAALPDTAF